MSNIIVINFGNTEEHCEAMWNTEVIKSRLSQGSASMENRVIAMNVMDTEVLKISKSG